jgi:hypothetical protein
MRNMNELAAAEKIALVKTIADKDFKAAKAELPEGFEGIISLITRTEVRVRKGSGKMVPSWPKSKYDLLAGIALSHVNEKTRNAIAREYAEVVRNHEEAESKAMAVAKEIKAEADTVLAEILGETKVWKEGTVTAKVMDFAVLEEVETHPIVS